MVSRTTFFLLFYFFSTQILSYGQEDSISVWQEEICNLINGETFSESSYMRLMEIISDLELLKSDTIKSARVKQHLIVRSDRCLNIREGYHDVTSEKQSQNKAYLGDAWNQTLRYKITVGNDWAGGITLNKDAGESFKRNPPYFDSYSAFLRHNTTILGHYRIKLGTGLVINQQFSLGKNIMSDVFMQNGTKVTPHSSTDEYDYMQGAVTNLRMGRVSVMPFISYKQIDASVKNDTITSISTDGYHRTSREAERRNAARVMNVGIHTSYGGDWYEIGLSLLHTRLSKPYFRPARTYNMKYFRGERLTQGSIDYHVRRYGVEMRGETAFDHDLNVATITKIAYRLNEDYKIGLLYRYYSRRYQQLYASSVSEGSGMQGEQGVMVTMACEPFAHWQAEVMVDYFSFANTQYGMEKPTSGVEISGDLCYKKSHWDMKMSYRMKLKNDFLHGFNYILLYNVNKDMKLKTQMRAKVFSPKTSGGYAWGYALAQAFIFCPEDAALSFELQGAYFNAEEYETRLYLAEKNILYGFGIPMLYGEGMRASVTGTYKLYEHLSLDVKYSLLHYFDRDHISSGLQQIGGKNQYNLWLQLRIKM